MESQLGRAVPESALKKENKSDCLGSDPVFSVWDELGLDGHCRLSAQLVKIVVEFGFRCGVGRDWACEAQV